MVVEQIHLAEIQNQALGYFVLQGIGNVIAPITSPLIKLSLTHLSDGRGTQ